MAFSKEEQPEPEPEEKHRSWGAMMVYNASPVFFTLCVLLLGAHTAQHRPVVGFAAVVGALLIYTFRATILQTRLRQVQESLNDSERNLRLLNSKLHEQSLIDPLTQIANRRRFEQVLEVEWNRALRSGWPISIVMLDIDHFKSLNDRYGHMRGDECLTAVAQMLRRDLRRGGELLARYGGEEFVAVLPNVDADGAMLTAEAMRARVHQIGIENHGSPMGRLTISVGVCSVVPVPGSPAKVSWMRRTPRCTAPSRRPQPRRACRHLSSSDAWNGPHWHPAWALTWSKSKLALAALAGPPVPARDRR